MNQSLPTRLAKGLTFLVVVIIVLLPFNEFLTTWIASNFGHLDFWRIYKELLIGLSLPFVGYLIYRSSALRRWFISDWLVRLIFLYALLCIVVGIWAYDSSRVNLFALSDGILTDLRFLAFFLVTATISTYSDFLLTHWRKILLWPGLVVVVLGLAQLFLPIDFLRHFGYGPNTIPAYTTVDQKIQYRRIQSTLRGSDPLGAYLVLVIPAFFLCSRRRLWLRAVAVGLSLAALFYTYSRSAYIGLGLTLVLLFYWSIKSKVWEKRILGLYILVGTVVIIGVVGLRNNQTAENIFFHTSNTSKSPTSSNAQRLGSLKTSLKEVEKQPLGGGTGTAGPASVHNNHPARIAENYYIQIAQEVGWLGLGLFLAINIVVTIKLWSKRTDPLARLLLASLVGISFIGLVSHVWADDTLSLLWWGLAGVALTPAIIKEQKHFSHETNKKPGQSKAKTAS